MQLGEAQGSRPSPLEAQHLNQNEKSAKPGLAGRDSRCCHAGNVERRRAWRLTEATSNSSAAGVVYWLILCLLRATGLSSISPLVQQRVVAPVRMVRRIERLQSGVRSAAL